MEAKTQFEQVTALSVRNGKVTVGRKTRETKKGNQIIASSGFGRWINLGTYQGKDVQMTGTIVLRDKERAARIKTENQMEKLQAKIKELKARL